MLKKVILIFTVMTLAAALLTGCGKSDSGKTTGDNIIKLENGNTFDVDAFCKDLDKAFKNMDLEFEITQNDSDGYDVNVLTDTKLPIASVSLLPKGINCEVIPDNIDTDDVALTIASVGLNAAICWYREVYGSSFDRDEFMKAFDIAVDQEQLDKSVYSCVTDYKETEFNLYAYIEAGTMFVYFK